MQSRSQMRRIAIQKGVPERCSSHAVDDFGGDMIASAIDAEERLARGEQQEQCSRCWRWLWPEQRGEGFVSTGQKDND